MNSFVKEWRRAGGRIRVRKVGCEVEFLPTQDTTGSDVPTEIIAVPLRRKRNGQGQTNRR
jgi:hypothetical protein